jgi:NAD(P)-dependent dehydrogenase (short-subunit alcohol dehydrogenase family)
MSLAGRRAIVTGGGSGVGAAIALALAEAGAEVWISGRRAEALAAVAARHEAIRWAQADVTDPVSVAAFLDTAGPAGIVVANAGSGTSAPFRKLDLETWDQTLAVNLTGVFLTFREGLARMPAGGGRLIAIASTAGLKGAPYVSAYTAAKHGVVGLVRALAMEVARDGISVNALCPSYIDSPMTDATVRNIAARTGMDETAARARLASTNPTGRLVRPEEVAAAALWLCSDAAAMITGQAIAISGGEA